MPFDGKAPEEFTPDFYSKMLERFQGGRYWTQRSTRIGSRHCLLGMAYNVKYGYGWPDVDMVHRDEFAEEFAQSLGFLNAHALVEWNDEDGRTWEQVETLLKANGACMTRGLFQRMMVLLRPAK